MHKSGINTYQHSRIASKISIKKKLKKMKNFESEFEENDLYLENGKRAKKYSSSNESEEDNDRLN